MFSTCNRSGLFGSQSTLSPCPFETIMNLGTTWQGPPSWKFAKLCTYQCKPRGEGGVRARGGDLTNIKIFCSNSPGWETKGQSKVSKETPPQGKKSKQTIL